MSVPQAKTVGFKPGERNVFFHLLTGCNLSCKHCYINPDQHGRTPVSKKRLGAWLELFSAPEKETNLILLGGEPTLHPDLAWGIKEAKRLGYTSVTVDTNGFLFHDLLDHTSPGELDFLSFSLDGPTPEVNDSIRGQGVFARCTENLKKAVARGFNVSVIYTVSSRNIDHLHKMPALLAQWGVKRFFIQVIGIRGKTSRDRPEGWQLNPEQWLTVVPPVARAAAGLGLTVIFPKVFLDEDEIFQCAGRVAENFFIFPNGRVYICPLCEDYPLNAFRIEQNRLLVNPGLTEQRLFALDIAEGCVMNKLLQPDNLSYDRAGRPLYRISCCLLKQEMRRPG